MDSTNEQDIERAKPADTGKGNDPAIRDETAAQPGVNTLSSSPYDEGNQHTTKTAGDGFKTPFGEDADKAFDEVGDN